MEEYDLGSISGHVVGRVLKETMRRATVAIRSERASFEAHTKQSYSGTMDDVFTSADTRAQQIYLQAFQECFPNCGVIGEEDSLVIEPASGCNAYFTVDPLDGTKAFVRRQSDGVGTMVALVYDGKIISAYVGDINTEEVYGYRPGSDHVHRITRLDTFEVLRKEESSDARKKHALLRNPIHFYSPAAQKLISQFKNYEVIGSSIGTWMARLWKREVGAVFMEPGWETPWDTTPIIGISQKLGYVFLRPKTSQDGWEEYLPIISKVKYQREHETMVIHKDDLGSLSL